MIYKTTKRNFESLSPFISENDVSVSNEEHEKKRTEAAKKSEIKLLSTKENNVWFEVFENEIVFCSIFTDHEHFDDYMAPPKDGEPNYIQRATGFLKRLFTLRRLKKNGDGQRQGYVRVEYVSKAQTARNFGRNMEDDKRRRQPWQVATTV